MNNTLENSNKASFTTLALDFSCMHMSKYTGYIHYKSRREQTRDLIPIYENVLYGIALIKSLAKEKAEKGFLHLEKVFVFFTPNGFPQNLHEYPNVYSDTTNVNVAFALTFFIKEFYSLIPKKVSTELIRVKEELYKILEARPLKNLDKEIFTALQKEELNPSVVVTNAFDLDRIMLTKLLLGEDVVLPYHRALGVYTGPLIETYYNGHKMVANLTKVIIERSAEEKIALQVALLPKKFNENCLSYERYPRDDLHVNYQSEKLSIHFSNHSIVASGDFSIDVNGDQIEITMDEFEDVAFYFSNNDNSKVLVKKKCATNFASEDSVFLITEEKEIELKFVCRKHNFTGILMKGNRENQLIDTRDFTFFDHKIFLRKTMRV